MNGQPIAISETAKVDAFAALDQVVNDNCTFTRYCTIALIHWEGRRQAIW